MADENGGTDVESSQLTRDSNVDSHDAGRLPPQQLKRSNSTDRQNAALCSLPGIDAVWQEPEVVNKEVLYANLQSLNDHVVSGYSCIGPSQIILQKFKSIGGSERTLER